MSPQLHAGGTRAAGGRRLGELLVASGAIDRQMLKRALDMQQMIGGRLGSNLLEIGAVDEPQLLEALGEQRATCTVRGEELTSIRPEVLRLVPSKLARRYHLVPYRKRGNTLYVASADPGDALHEDEIAFLTSTMVRTCIGLEARVQIALHRHYGAAIDARFVALAQRRRRGTGAQAQVARPAPESPSVDGAAPSPTPGSDSASPSARSLEPTPATPRASSRPGASSPASSSPASTRPASTSPASTSPASTRPTSTRPTSTRQRRTSPSPEREFIELDTDDLALLRRQAEPGDRVAAATPSGATPSDAIPTGAIPTGAIPTGAIPTGAIPTGATPTLDSESVDDAIEPTESTEPTESGIDADASPDERLHDAARLLQQADIRDEIGDVLLEFAAPYLRRRMLFFVRKSERILGWQGAGAGVDEAALRAIDLDARLPTLFSSLRDTSSFWLGPLAPLPENRKLLAVLGEPAPRECLALPVVLRGKVICYLYGDNLDQGVASAPLEELRRLVRKAGVAFEVYILKNKIRLL